MRRPSPTYCPKFDHVRRGFREVCNFLGAGRTQIFLEEGTPLGVERWSPAFDDVRYRRRRDWEAQRRPDEPTPSDCFTAVNLAWPLGGIGQEETVGKLAESSH